MTCQSAIVGSERVSYFGLMSMRKAKFYMGLILRYYVLGFPATIVDLAFRCFLPFTTTKGIRVIDPILETRDEFHRLVSDAVTLIAARDQRRFKRIQREIRVIINHPAQSAARYFRPLRTCAVDLTSTLKIYTRN